MYTTEDYRRLARAVVDRRTELERTQIDVAQAGGLSPDRVSAIERAEAPNLRPKTTRALERGLKWAQGSVKVVLDGGDPTPRGESPPEPPGKRGGFFRNPVMDEAERIMDENERLVREITEGARQLDDDARHMVADLVNMLKRKAEENPGDRDHRR